MENTIIYSAGLTTRSIIEIFRKNDIDLSIVGIIDDDKELSGTYKFGKKILSDLDKGLETFSKYRINRFIIGIGSYKYHFIRNDKFDKLKSFGLQPINCISDEAYLSLDSFLGLGNIIFPFAMIGSGTKIGDNCLIDVSTSILEETIIENNVHVCSNSFVGACCIIEKNVYIGPGVTIASGVKIGENSVIGAGSVIMKDVPKNSKGYGNPFQLIK